MKLTVLSVAFPFAPVGPDAIGGAEQVLTMLDHALVESGHRSIIVACETSRTCGELAASVACPEALSADVCHSRRQQHRRRIQEMLATRQVDVVHMHGVDFHEYLPDTDLPIVVTLHLPPDFYPERVFQDLPANVHLRCVSTSQAQDCPPGARSLPIIQNGVDVERFAARHAKRKVAIALGRICPEKGFHHAIAAARRADVPLLVGGEAFGYETHRRYFRDEFLPRLDRRRRWIGPVDFARKRRLLTGARCLLVPSLVPETSSLVAMEALACGTPVIAFPNGALREVVEDGQTGFLVTNEVEMAAAIGKAHLIDSERCRAAARERFSLKRTCSAYLQLYERLAREGQRARDVVEAPCVV